MNPKGGGSGKLVYLKIGFLLTKYSQHEGSGNTKGD